MKRAFVIPVCTVCLEVPADVIYQCYEGHIVCAGCMDALWARSLRSCPTCRGDLPEKRLCIRSRVAEDLVASSMLSCEDCNVEMSRADMRQHHLPCPRRVGRRILSRFGNRAVHYVGLAGAERVQRVEYMAPHEAAGETHYFEDCVLTEIHYDETTSRAGEVWHFRSGMHATTTFCDARRGASHHMEDGEHVRTTWAAGHKHAGVVQHIVDNVCAWLTFEECHLLHGTVLHIENDLPVRETYEAGHLLEGTVIHIEKGVTVRTTFTADHPENGLVLYYESGKLTRAAYGKGHARCGQVECFLAGVPVGPGSL
jgi:hypothetical protein